MLTTRHDKIFAIASVFIVLFAVWAGLAKPGAASAGFVPPDTKEQQVGNAKVNVPNPNSASFKQPDPKTPGKCVGGDKSCKPPCGISSSSLGTCESKVAGCQTNNLPSCTDEEKSNEKGDGKKGDEKPPEMPKLPEMPKGGGDKGGAQPKGDPCQEGSVGGGTTNPDCKKATTGTGSFLESLMGGATKVSESITNAAGSALESLQSMVSPTTVTGVDDSISGNPSRTSESKGSSSTQGGATASGSNSNTNTNSGSRNATSGASPTGLGATTAREGGTMPTQTSGASNAGTVAPEVSTHSGVAGFGPPPSSGATASTNSTGGGITGTLSSAISALGGLLANFSNLFHF